MTLDEAIQEFEFDCKIRHLSPKTIDNYKKQLRYFERFLLNELSMVFHDQAVDFSGPIAKLETFISLSQQRPDHYVRVGIDLDDMDVTPAESKASYQEIKDWVLAHTGLKASCLYIAQVEAKHGIIERVCYYNKAKMEGGRVPKCPPEKEKAIEEELRHFQMIP